MIGRSPRHRFSVIGIGLAGLLLLATLGGCPIDADELAADVTAAALTSISESLVDALELYLAGN